MRSNGLDAASYVAIADLDPRVADAMLERLRDERIAAYAEPQQAPTGPLLDVTPPVSPTERLFVDDQQEPRARALLQEHLADAEGDDIVGGSSAAGDSGDPLGSSRASADPTVDGPTVHGPTVDDAAWQELVASFHRSGETPVGRWPVQEELSADESPTRSRAPDLPEPGSPEPGSAEPGSAEPGPAEPGPAEPGPAEPGPAEPGPAEPGSAEPGEQPSGQPPEGAGDAADSGDRPTTASPVLTAPGPKPASDDEHFVPPPPPPLPRLDPITKAAWLGLIGGPIVLILALVTDWYFPYWLRVGAAAGFALGFLVLVFRSRGGTVDDSDGTGAIV